MLRSSLSPDGERIVFVTIDDEAHSPVWIASLSNPEGAHPITTTNAGVAFFGAPGEVVFAAVEDFAILRIKESGADSQKLNATPLIPLGVSPDGRWIAVQDPRAWGALIVYPASGGSPTRLCDHCAPPWGVDPIPFYLGWSPDGKFLFWNFTGSTYAIPLPAGRLLPETPAAGLQSPDAISSPGGTTSSPGNHTRSRRRIPSRVHVHEGHDAAEHLPGADT